MTAPSRLPAHPSTAKPMARPRRVKRGIVAGYIHDISPRHRATEVVAPVTKPSTPVAAAVEPHQA
ncbi:hypothetical protein DSM104299_01509 [Baekduia alba]|uniref:hypothetical protein n=1 Tax=Baekduia alba TaxID=2997333 RepID=UPI002341E4D1|nr:hypothetical protein [Baekduia alba]WCB92809.1 hypothetical protein DSM104299_01509 [Baekduia alba]